MDTSFKDYSELYKWASEGKPIEWNRSKWKADNNGHYGAILNSRFLDDYKKVFEKEKVQMYKHWCTDFYESDKPIYSRESNLDKESYEKEFKVKIVKTITLEPITLD